MQARIDAGLRVARGPEPRERRQRERVDAEGEAHVQRHHVHGGSVHEDLERAEHVCAQTREEVWPKGAVLCCGAGFWIDCCC